MIFVRVACFVFVWPLAGLPCQLRTHSDGWPPSLDSVYEHELRVWQLSSRPSQMICSMGWLPQQRYAFLTGMLAQDVGALACRQGPLLFDLLNPKP